MRTRSLILGALFLAAPLSAQQACDEAAACCKETAAAQVVQVQRARPASLTQDAAPVALVAADRGYLGVRMETGAEGMRILEVIPGSGAEAAGLQAGDRILTVAGTSTGEDGVQAVLQELAAGEKVKITYDRGGETRKAKVTLMTLAEIEESVEEIELEEPPVVEETPEIEWIENIEQDLVEEIAELDAASNVGTWVTFAQPAPGADDRGYLGVSLDTSGEGLAILDVYDESPAEEAGLRAGDVLLQFDGQKGGPEDQLGYMRGKKVGDEVQVRYRRGDDVGRTKIALGPLRSGTMSFGIAQGGPEGIERVLVRPEIQWQGAGEPLRIEAGDMLDLEEARELVLGDAGGGQHRVRLFTTRTGDRLDVEAVLEEDEHEHADQHGEHAEHAEHGDVEEFMIHGDPRGLGGERIQRIRLLPDPEELHTHDGDTQGRIVIKRIENGEESVEEYAFDDGDHDGLPDHVRELLHRHMGDQGADHDAPQRLPRRAALDLEEGRRIQWAERAPAPPRRPAAERGQQRLIELQQRVRELERRIAELERALERTVERPRERRVRRDR